MAGTINFQYNPAQVVWVIAKCSDNAVLSVQRGTVIRIRAEVLTSGTSLEYDVRLDGNTATTKFIENDVYVDLSSAVAAYQIRITP